MREQVSGRLQFFLHFVVFFSVLVSFVSAPLIASAQFTGTATTEETDAILNGEVYIPSGGYDPVYDRFNENNTVNLDGTVTTGSATGQTGTNAAPTQTTETSTSIQDTVTYANTYSINTFHGAIIYIGGWVAGMAGNVFEYSFDYFIIRLGCFFTNDTDGRCQNFTFVTPGSIGGVVNELWKTVRDLFNLALIFALIYTGFRLILNADDSGARKGIGGVIIAGLLVNFSLYIAKLIVDITNFTALQIYGHMMGNGNVYSIDNLYSIGGSGGQVGNNIAGAFMEVLKVASWFNTTISDDNFAAIAFAVMALIFLFLLAGVFFYGAFMMLTRFIAIVILLVFSPAMFLGYVLPQFSGYSEKWRKMFVAYCMYAPIYVFMLYMSLYVMLQFVDTFKGDANGYGSAFTGDGVITAQSMGIFAYFFIGIGFLIASTKVAGMAANAGAGGSMRLAHDFAHKAVGFTTGLASAGATMPLWASGNLATSAANALEKRTGRSTASSRLLNYTGNKLTNQKLVSDSAAKKLGVSNITAKGAYTAAKDWNKKSVDAGNERANKLYDEAQKKNKFNDNFDKLTKGTSGDTQQRGLAALKPAQVVEAAKKDGGLAALKRNAAFLRPDQIKALEEDKELNKKDLSEILEARKVAIKNKFSYNTDTEKPQSLGKARADELAVFDLEDLIKPENAVQLSDDQIGKLPEKFIDSDKDAIKEARKQAIITIAKGTAEPELTQIMSKDDLVNKAKPADIAKYPDEALIALATELPIPALSKIAQDGNIKKQTQRSMRDALKSEIQSYEKDSVTPPHTKAYKDWLDNSPLGKQFGN